MKIFFSKSAFEDFESIKEYYMEEGVPHIGEKFVSYMVKHTETLVDNPSIGRMVPEFEEPKIRELIHPPFRIVYLREVTSIHVIRIWRSERVLELPEEKS